MASVMYAVGWTAPGTVYVCAIEAGGSLTLLQTVASGGALPCHLLVDASGRAIYVSNYGDGVFSAMPLAADGRIVGPAVTFPHTGSGPIRDRQECSHAHSATSAPGGEHLLVADLGTDEMRRYRIDANGMPVPDGIAGTLPPGSGPRHVAVVGDYLYVSCELNDTVTVLHWVQNEAAAQVVGAETVGSTNSISACDLFFPSSDSGVVAKACVDLPGHVASNRAGDRLYVSGRGADVITTFEIGHDGGSLTRLAETPVGHWPRHFAVTRDALVVAEERAGRVRVYPLNPYTGIPQPAVATYEVPTPASIVMPRCAPD